MTVDCTQDLPSRLASIARTCGWFMDSLHAAKQLGLNSWCIGAGAVRNLVWDHLHGFGTPSGLPDVDVAYFDPLHLSPERDTALAAALSAARPEFSWEVTNQAAVHLWYEPCFGLAVEPLPSLDAAIATWPEYATCVGVGLDDGNHLRIHAPHGLEDLFNLVVRHNPARADLKTYQHRLRTKRFQQRWPQVRIIL